MSIMRLVTVSFLGAALAVSVPSAHAQGDSVHFGDNVHVAADETVHDAVCFFCNVDVQGEVKGDIVVFFGNVHIAGKADHDVVNFFGGISAEDNTEIGNDMVSMFGLIRLGENVSVGKDLVAMFGGIRAPESVHVGGDRVGMPVFIFFGPLVLIGLVIALIVRAFRDYRRRQYFGAYQYPPMP